MTVNITPRNKPPIASALLKGGIQRVLEETGSLPPVSMVLSPINGTPSIFLDKFLTYNFRSSILIPVDSFSFTAAYPDDIPFYDRVKDGDTVNLYANDLPLATGIIDMPDVETDREFGEKISITGRDLMAQFEDQSCVSSKYDPIYAGNYTVAQVAQKLMENTKVNGFRLQQAPSGSYLFATEPGENKISALQRFLEPLNCLSWMDPNGAIVLGRPNFSQKPLGTLFLIKSERRANVTSMRASRNSTSIPTTVLPIWTGQENVQSRVAKEQALDNAAEGPSRLRSAGYFVPRTVVVSTPQGASPQDLSGVNQIRVGGSNILQAYAKREVARQNHKELLVQAVVPGHYNENGDPYAVDQVYRIRYDRGSVDEAMYLFDVEYHLSEEGQNTVLHFCRLGTMVADARAP